MVSTNKRKRAEEDKYYLINKIVLVIAANKSDLYQYEDVPEIVGKSFAKEINAIFIQTSAKSSTGIDVGLSFIIKQDLFYFAGSKMLDPKFDVNGSNQEESLMKIRIKNNINLQYDTADKKDKKKKCCK